MQCMQEIGVAKGGQLEWTLPFPQEDGQCGHVGSPTSMIRAYEPFKATFVTLSLSKSFFFDSLLTYSWNMHELKGCIISICLYIPNLDLGSDTYIRWIWEVRKWGQVQGSLGCGGDSA